MQQPAATLFLQSIAVTADGDDVTVVQQTIEDGGGDDGIAEYRAPLADAAVAGEQDCTAFVTTADELKEEMCCTGLQRQVPELIDNQEFRFDVGEQSVIEPPLRMALGEICDERGSGYKQNRIACDNRLAADAIAKWVLPTPGEAASYCRVSE
jgi:hypothetical protein